jgi:predicted NUDIX family NTP pyrophosphohydrolase
MLKLSAGILLYKFNEEGQLQVLLVHPGGPFWRNKDESAWSIPKGEYFEGEDALMAARREFEEETGSKLPSGECVALNAVKLKSGKIICAWALEADFDTSNVESNTFEMEWPPKSGKKQSFAEIDKAAWFSVTEAKVKINDGQVDFLNQLTELVINKKS